MTTEEEYNFVKWQTRRGGIGNRLFKTVTVGKSGYVYLSEDIFTEHLTSSNFVEVFVDEAKRTVGIKSAKDGFKINITDHKKKHNTPTRLLCMKSLMLTKKILAGRYEAKWNEKYGMILFNYQQQEDEKQKEGSEKPIA
jgi:hypothetical protein